MLWNKRKPTDPARVAAAAPDRSGYRVAEPDRALSAIGSLLTSFGRFAFDTDLAAGLVREQCEHWARRITLGEPSTSGPEIRAGEPSTSGQASPDATPGEVASPVARDWRGLERFFADQRKREGEYVERAVGTLRRAVLSLGRALGTSIGEDRSADAVVEERLGALERAVEHGDVGLITQAANASIAATRTALVKRREREARQAAKLDKELRDLRDALGGDAQRGATDELTGLYTRGAYEQQLEQLCALGGLLEQPPWFVLIEVSAGKPDAGRRGNERPRPVPDATLRAASHSLSRTFLRRHDFAARSGTSELSVFVVDMTQAEVNAAVERLIIDLYNAGRSLSRGEAPSVTIGVARLRADDDVDRWRTRADLALQRAREDGGDCHRVAL
jgi:diguanylate cyclase (GGDEF)-like protein